MVSIPQMSNAFCSKKALPKSPTSTILPGSFFHSMPLKVAAMLGAWAHWCYQDHLEEAAFGANDRSGCLLQVDEKMRFKNGDMMICSFLRTRFSEINQSPGFFFDNKRRGTTTAAQGLRDVEANQARFCETVGNWMPGVFLLFPSFQRINVVDMQIVDVNEHAVHIFFLEDILYVRYIYIYTYCKQELCCYQSMNTSNIFGSNHL